MQNALRVENGYYISGGGNSQSIVSLTWAQYDALPESKKMDGTIYEITDRNVMVAPANLIPYDNTDSGLEATDVNGAIDEVASDLSGLMNPEYVEVEISSKTYAQMITAIANEVDYTKVTANSYIVNPDNQVLRISNVPTQQFNSRYTFLQQNYILGYDFIGTAVISYTANNSGQWTYANKSSESAPNGKYRLYY